jgi:lipopolysaccharide export system permease protein
VIVGRFAAWLSPAEASAQTPAPALSAGSPPSSAAPASQAIPRPARPVTLTSGAGLSDDRTRQARQRAAMYEVEIQKKYAIAAACLVFAIVGMPIALRYPRGGTGLVLATSVVVFAIYYVGLIGGEELGDRLVVSPFLAMWAPNLLFAVVGLLGLRIVDRQGTSPRRVTDLFRALRWRPDRG